MNKQELGASAGIISNINCLNIKKDPAEVFLKNISYLFNSFGINMNLGFSNKELSQLT